MEKLTIDHLKNYKYLSGMNVSADKRYIGFHVNSCNMETNGYDSDFWVLDLTDNTLVQMTTSGKAASHQWRLKEDAILYASQKDEKVKASIESGEPLTVFYELNIHGGESREFMRIPLSVSGIKEIDENLFLVSAQYDPKYSGYTSMNEEERKAFLEKHKEDKDYEVADEIPFWSNGASFMSGRRNRLYLYDSTKGDLKPITDEKESVSFHHWDEKRRKMLYASKTYEGQMPLMSDLYLYDLESGDRRKLLEETHAFYFAYFLNDDKIIFIGNDQKKVGLNQNPDFFTLDLSSGTIKILLDSFDKSIGNSVGSDMRFGSRRSLKVVDDELYFVTTEDDSAYLNQLSSSGKIERIVTEKGAVDDFEVAGDRVVINALRGTRPEEIYEVMDKQEVLISNFNGWVGENLTLSTPEEITFRNDEDITIKGWVMKPIDYDPEKKYPAILNIHGGPKTVYGSVFYHEMQVWANAGYFVFFCNPRGSDGKGNAFADIRGKYGTIDYQDIMQFTDVVLIKNKAIDIDNVFVTGGSYGGFMTNWIIGHTNRFKAAASQRSISNWTTEYGVTDIGYYFVPDQIAADPWSDYEKLWDHSPLKYANLVETPTLFIHSDMDYRCWLPEALQMFTAIKQFGVDSRLCVFKGENHELSRSGKPKHRIRRIEEITNWFEKYRN